MMVSSKPITNPATDLQRVVVVEPKVASYIGIEVASALKNVFSSISLEFVGLETASSRALAGDFMEPGLSVVSLLESEKHVFARCSKNPFEAIRDVILHSTKCL